ncbi:hypothetical protein JZ751_002516 [Albula glossodonta]|uniref:Uncharacterized protein n=1 Tax=Albula glossodonta TaxID=121402 RepID=A0A8T2N729_9TELE|nr:hypothetical protein JZ751_002516 [Albula glossodonta]
MLSDLKLLDMDIQEGTFAAAIAPPVPTLTMPVMLQICFFRPNISSVSPLSPTVTQRPESPMKTDNFEAPVGQGLEEKSVALPGPPEGGNSVPHMRQNTERAGLPEPAGPLKHGWQHADSIMEILCL